jgi:di/tricarboxylate transporter
LRRDKDRIGRISGPEWRASLTWPQIFSLAVLGGMMCLFWWDRIRFDVVALITLLAAVACGIVPSDKAFNGFSNSLLPLIASALILSAAVGQSGILDVVMRPLRPVLHSRRLQIGALAGAVAALSAMVKNIGALALFLPVAMQVARRGKRPVAQFLMPMSFASLVGGMMTLIGTSPNLIISSVRQELFGAPYKMFDFFPVGFGVTLVAVAFLSVGWRLIPIRRSGQNLADQPFRVEDYVAEARLPEGSALAGKTVTELEALADQSISVIAIIREGDRRYIPAGHWTLFAGDVLVLESDPNDLQKLVESASLELVGSKDIAVDENQQPITTGKVREKAVAAGENKAADKATDKAPDKIEAKTDAKAEAKAAASRSSGEEKKSEDKQPSALGVVEAVVTPSSPMIGASALGLKLREHYGVNLLAMSRAGRRMGARLRNTQFREGDVVVLQGPAEAMNESLAALGCLPLAERNLQLGKPRNSYLPVLILLVCVVLSATEWVPVALAFTGGAVTIAVLRILTLKQIYDAIDWPILILLGCLIPVGEAVRTTGTTEVIAGWLSYGADALPVYGTLAMLLVITMLVTPFLHHAAAVIVMGPVAAVLAKQLGFNADPFLIAVAVGASCDFLSPIGHQCNTLVMGPGGYHFSDYWHLGLPLTFLVTLTGVPLILAFWPLH